jgi:hypothetical protein
MADDLHQFDQDDPRNPIPEINKTFYRDYDEEYFVSKAILLGSMVANPKSMKEHLGSGYSVGKLKVNNLKTTQKWLKGYAKREIVINSYHAIESFFRLFFAHVEEPECPWIGVEQMKNFKEFKSRIEKLLKREYFKNDHDKAVAEILFGSRSMYSNATDDDWNENVKKAVELVDRLGHDILNNQDYNVYKHGAALLDTQFGFKLDDGKVLGADKQDVFMYLNSTTEKTPDKLIKKFSKTFKFMRWQNRVASTYMAGQLMHNMLTLQKLHFKLLEPKKAKIYTFQKHDLNKILDGDNKGRIAMPSTVSESLFERHYVTKKKSKN